ncbi:four helix bundle protein [Candidatus Peribacteria bacterium]|nr:four helix bundle protein [Candidatus Peribacteria bacterium]
MYKKYSDGFRKLIAWQEAHKLTLNIYKITKNFPREEMYGITSQLRRASSSVAAQITEGSRMPTLNHRKSYYDRAYSSVVEVDYFLELSKDLEYLNGENYKELLEKVNRVAYLTKKLSNSCV